MKFKPSSHSFRYSLIISMVGLTLVALLVYSWRVANNPPGFYIDESSVAYNAYTIAREGKDEFGNSWPLFFPAFGDYKNPIYVYLLALVFKVFGPGIFAARMLSALAGTITVVLLSLLAARISKRPSVGLYVGIMALFTPWLFELSRVALEVAIFPLAITAFLLWLQNASRRENWSRFDVSAIALTLALTSYSYSIGRLLGPLLALGLLFFCKSAGWSRIVQTWILYGLTLTPMLIFHTKYPEALVGRFKLVSYIDGEASFGVVAAQFLSHFAASFDPRRLLVTGDPNLYQVVHLLNTPAILATTFVLALWGGFRVLRWQRSNPWWRFIIYALAAAVIPASLTQEYFHMLRLAAMPVLLLVLTVPAFTWLSEARDQRSRPRFLLPVIISLTILQGVQFQWTFHRGAEDSWRRHLFDADYEDKIFKPAIALPHRPIYLADAIKTPYIQAYWYATMYGFPVSDFSRLEADQTLPAGALVISTEEWIPEDQVLARVEPYTLYISSQEPRSHAPMPEGSFRARIDVADAPDTLSINQPATIRARVKNESDVMWLARERLVGPYQVSLGNHWLDADGRMVTNDDGRTPLRHDLGPGEERELTLTIRAPNLPGQYLLEIDMLQEGVSWFGLRGSKTVRLLVTVK